MPSRIDPPPREFSVNRPTRFETEAPDFDRFSQLLRPVETRAADHEFTPFAAASARTASAGTATLLSTRIAGSDPSSASCVTRSGETSNSRAAEASVRYCRTGTKAEESCLRRNTPTPSQRLSR